MKKRILIPLVLLVIAGIAVMGSYAKKQLEQEVPLSAGMSVYAQAPKDFVVRNGEVHPLRQNVETLLLVGTDSEEDAPELPEDIVPFYNQIQADVLFLIAIDNDAKTYTAIQVNRDTMTDVPWYDVLGTYGGTVYEQIALSHNSGSGGADSLIVTADTVSSLLFSLPIDHALALNMTCISALNDVVGGVTVEIVDDMTAVDPAFVKGQTLTLKGEQAENYLRARMVLADDTNTARMARHRQYIDGLMLSAREAKRSDPNIVTKAADSLSEYLVTDMTVQQLDSLVAKLDEYEFRGVVTAKGELVRNEHYEFYVDEDDLWGIVVSACCE